MTHGIRSARRLAGLPERAQEVTTAPLAMTVVTVRPGG